MVRLLKVRTQVLSFRALLQDASPFLVLVAYIRLKVFASPVMVLVVCIHPRLLIETPISQPTSTYRPTWAQPTRLQCEKHHQQYHTIQVHRQW